MTAMIESFQNAARAAGLISSNPGPSQRPSAQEALAMLVDKGFRPTALELRLAPPSAPSSPSTLLFGPARPRRFDGAEASIDSVGGDNRGAGGRGFSAMLMEPRRQDVREGDQPCIVVFCPSETSSADAGYAEALSLAGKFLSLRICVLALNFSALDAPCEAAHIRAAVEKLRDVDFRRERGWPVPPPPSDEGEDEVPDRILPTIALWGRSAGANAALSYAATDPMLCALVCDTAYSDLPSLMGLPSWMSQPLAGLQKLSMCSPGASPPHRARSPLAASEQEPQPWEIARSLWMPALYMCGQLDSGAPMYCARALRESHAGDKELMFVARGTRDSERPDYIEAHAAVFVHKAMRVSDEDPRLWLPLSELRKLAASNRDPSLAIQEPQPALQRPESPQPEVWPFEEESERQLLREVLNNEEIYAWQVRYASFEWTRLPVPECSSTSGNSRAIAEDDDHSDHGAALDDTTTAGWAPNVNFNARPGAVARWGKPTDKLINFTGSLKLPEIAAEGFIIFGLVTGSAHAGKTWILKLSCTSISFCEVEVPLNTLMERGSKKSFFKLVLVDEHFLEPSEEEHEVRVIFERSGKVSVQLGPMKTEAMATMPKYPGSLSFWTATLGEGTWDNFHFAGSYRDDPLSRSMAGATLHSGDLSAEGAPRQEQRLGLLGCPTGYPNGYAPSEVGSGIYSPGMHGSLRPREPQMSLEYGWERVVGMSPLPCASPWSAAHADAAASSTFGAGAAARAAGASAGAARAAEAAGAAGAASPAAGVGASDTVARVAAAAADAAADDNGGSEAAGAAGAAGAGAAVGGASPGRAAPSSASDSHSGAAVDHDLDSTWSSSFTNTTEGEAGHSRTIVVSQSPFGASPQSAAADAGPRMELRPAHDSTTREARRASAASSPGARPLAEEARSGASAVAPDSSTSMGAVAGDETPALTPVSGLSIREAIQASVAQAIQPPAGSLTMSSVNDGSPPMSCSDGRLSLSIFSEFGRGNSRPASYSVPVGAPQPHRFEEQSAVMAHFVSPGATSRRSRHGSRVMAPSLASVPDCWDEEDVEEVDEEGAKDKPEEDASQPGEEANKHLSEIAEVEEAEVSMTDMAQDDEEVDEEGAKDKPEEDARQPGEEAKEQLSLIAEVEEAAESMTDMAQEGAQATSSEAASKKLAEEAKASAREESRKAEEDRAAAAAEEEAKSSAEEEKRKAREERAAAEEEASRAQTIGHSNCSIKFMAAAAEALVEFDFDVDSGAQTWPPPDRERRYERQGTWHAGGRDDYM